jgi:hypothetical protein
MAVRRYSDSRTTASAIPSLLTSNRLRSAVTSALQHAQIGAPRTDFVAILVGHHAG